MAILWNENDCAGHADSYLDGKCYLCGQAMTFPAFY